MSLSPAIALVPYLGAADDGLNPWLRLHPSERRRLAMQAARERDAAALWGLTDAWLHTDPRHGTVAAGTTKNYRTGLRHLLDAWRQEDPLRPVPDAAAAYVRALERRGLGPGTITNRLATARGLYAALRWARAVWPTRLRACTRRVTRPRPGRSACPMTTTRSPRSHRRQWTRTTACWCCWGRTRACARASAWPCAGRMCAPDDAT